MVEINFLESFPKIERNLEPGSRNELNKLIAKRFDKEFFDGDRANGYGGYYYDGRWIEVVKKFVKTYGLDSNSSVLDIGCAKGFLVYDFVKVANINAVGIDPSAYAINHAMDGYKKYALKNGSSEEKSQELEEMARDLVAPRVIVGSGLSLPWADKTFDLVLSINSLHNFNREDLKKAIGEMNRVGKTKSHKFLQLDSWRNEAEKDRMMRWALTAETMMSDKEWLKFFEECNYDGDYSWTII